MKEVIAIILAGGQGERLSILSEQRAKPAVPFAGKYRIIDFTLSNCVNSGIYNVLVLTQYRPLSLHDHIGTGRPWDLDRNRGGVRLISPYLRNKGADWYRGTADAVAQNLRQLADTPGDLVLILGGDHIYKMDYRQMIDFHIKSRATCTVGTLRVSLEEATRFGIMSVDKMGKVLEFQEKPKKPKGDLASMGIYVFDKKVLMEKLMLDSGSQTSKHDFGHSIIPSMVQNEEAIFAFPFEGYWRDVGTVESYWEANMELLEEKPALNLYERNWIISTKSEERPPALVSNGANVQRSLISHGCVINGEVSHSVLSPGVRVEAGAVIRNSIVMFDTIVRAGSVLDRVIVDKEVEIGANCKIGYGEENIPNELYPQRLNTGLTLIGKRASVPPGFTIGRNCLIAGEVEAEDFPTDSKEIASGKSVMANDERLLKNYAGL